MNRYLLALITATALLWLAALQHLANLPNPSSTYITSPRTTPLPTPLPD